MCVWCMITSYDHKVVISLCRIHVERNLIASQAICKELAGVKYAMYFLCLMGDMPPTS